MTIQLIDVQAVAPQPWRNGGGQTRELVAWPVTGPWKLRISRADIDTDGPFSAFAGVTRWFAVLRGAGVCLDFAGRQRALGVGDAPVHFDGGRPPACRLLGGPTQDLNLMASGGNAVMCTAVAGAAWDAAWQMRGLYTSSAGQWHGPQGARAIAAHTLLWDDAAEPGGWTFMPESANSGRALWLGFSAYD